MQLAGWLRTLVWRAEDWRAALAGALDEVRGANDAVRALELGRALEYLEPDRRKALEAYLVAFAAGQDQGAHAAARRLAREVRAHAMLARLSTFEYERGGDPACLWAIATAWIDAGEAGAARKPLIAAVKASPDDLRFRSALAAIDGSLRDSAGEVGRWFERASSGGTAQDAIHAARLARITDVPDDKRMRILRLALDRWPEDDEVGLLVEDLLIARGDPDELLTFYRMRLQTRRGARAWADEVRAAATRLCVRGIAPGLGLRLARRGLEHAYNAGLVDIPGHLASWSLLLEHGRTIKATRELMPLAVQALKLALSDDDRLWLARLGLEVAWRDAGDADAARSYAAIVAELAPDHHDVREFVVDQVHFDIDVDGEDVDPDIADLAMSLVYLDEHEGRVVEQAVSARDAVKRTEVAVAASPSPPPPPVTASKPAWMSVKTVEMAAVGQAATETTTEVVESPPAPPTPPPAPPPAPPTPPPAPAPPPVTKPARTIPVIPSAAMAALRRIGARVRVPTLQPLPDGARDRAERVVVPVDVRVELDDGTSVEAVVRDISTTGLFIMLETALELETEVTLQLRLPGAGADALTLSTHRAWARVARRGDGGVGLELLDPAPELIEAIEAITASR